MAWKCRSVSSSTVDQLGCDWVAESEAVRLLPVPVALPGFQVKQHWHERYHADVSNRWLRQTVADLFLE